MYKLPISQMSKRARVDALDSTICAPPTTPIVPYRGRLAPSPTGLLHMGHAKTFWWAYQRAKDAGGTLIMRNEDLDQSRAKMEFAASQIEDLRYDPCSEMYQRIK